MSQTVKWLVFGFVGLAIAGIVGILGYLGIQAIKQSNAQTAAYDQELVQEQAQADNPANTAINDAASLGADLINTF